MIGSTWRSPVLSYLSEILASSSVLVGMTATSLATLDPEVPPHADRPQRVAPRGTAEMEWMVGKGRLFSRSRTFPCW